MLIHANFRTILLAASGLALWTAAPAAAQDQCGCGNASAQATAPSATAEADQGFVTSATQGGLSEVELGRLAEARTSNPVVTAFARRMIRDHKQNDRQLKQVASSQGLTVPATINSDEQHEYDKLAALSGPEFDRAYIDYEAQDHQHDISEFRQEVENGQDPAVKAYASQTLPTLEEHLGLAQQAQNQLSAEAPGGPAAGSYATPNSR